MFSSKARFQSIVQDFRIDYMMRYSLFVPRLYNLCISLGFEAGNIMPSRAFCSDENQGFPIILIAKHFGAFPFNHGQVGGVVATDRHVPHAQHGKDMVIIQASHVGYDPESMTFGSYCRLQTPGDDKTITCGKVGDVIQWYLDEYRFAQNTIYLYRDGGDYTIIVDNQLLDEKREEGLFLDLDRLIKVEEGRQKLLKTHSTSRVYSASDELRNMLPEEVWKNGKPVSMGEYLDPELFVFKRKTNNITEGRDHLENNLIDAMPWIVTSSSPLLVAAQVNTQMEFDRTFRSLVKERVYRGKNLLFVSCLNIDISPRGGQTFPLTKCVPWAAYYQGCDGDARTYEQAELVDLIMQQSEKNPDQINLEDAILQMINAPEVKIEA